MAKAQTGPEPWQNGIIIIIIIIIMITKVMA